MKLKRGDTVQVLIGKDKGKVSKIDRIFPVRGKILVEGVNQYKRHVKGRANAQKSEIVTITKPLSVSSVALVCPKCKRTTRIGYTIDSKGKVRVCRKCEESIG